MTTKEQQKKKKSAILSIYPNFRGFGYAIMEEALKVLDAQVISTIRPVSNQGTLARIRNLIDYYEPSIVVLEDYNGISSRKSMRIKKVIDTIIKYAGKKELNIEMYSRANIRIVFSSFNAHTKHEIATVISENIPVMKTKLMDKRKPDETEKYTAGAFDAVSLGITHFYLKE
jgi:Holliday junction resolvasome RuvABC endonuclease subunit